MADFHKKAKTDKPYNQGKIVSNSTGGGDDFSTRSSNPTVHNPVSKQVTKAPGGNAPMPPHGQPDQNTLTSFSGSPNKKHFLHGGPCKGKAETLAYWTIDQGEITGRNAVFRDLESLNRILRKLLGESNEGYNYAEEIMPPLSYMNADHPVGGEEQHEAAAVEFANFSDPLFWGGGIGFLLKHIQGQLEGKCGCWVSLGGFADLFTWWLGAGTTRAAIKKLGKLGEAKNAARAALFKKASTMSKYNTTLSSNWATRWNAILPGGIGGISNGMVANPASASVRNALRAAQKTLTAQLLAVAKKQNLNPTVKEQYRQLKALAKEWDDFMSEVNRKRSIMDSDVEKVWRYHVFQEGKDFYDQALFTSYQAAWAGVMKELTQRFGVFLTALVQRPKQCYGNNTFLNPDTCECECVEDATECGFMVTTSATASDPLTGPVTFRGFIDSTIEDTVKRARFFFDSANPNLFPQSNELISCEVACPCNLTHTSYTGVCKCTNCLGGYTWKTGGVCNCAKDVFLVDVLGNGSWGKEHGQCVDDDVDSKETALGKTWDGKEICGYVCPSGTHVADGRSPDGCSRLEDNLSDSDVPTKQHFLYKTGCNYVCDERAISENCDPFPNGDASSFPPTCDAGYVWDGQALGCLCREIPPACPSDDPACKRDDILNGEVAQDGEGGEGTTFFFRGCNGCTGNVPGPNNMNIVISNPGSVDALKALIAGWAGDVVEREGQENYRICVTRTGGPIYFWNWYAYDCEPEGCGPCS